MVIKPKEPDNKWYGLLEHLHEDLGKKILVGHAMKKDTETDKWVIDGKDLEMLNYDGSTRVYLLADENAGANEITMATTGQLRAWVEKMKKEG